MKPNSLEQERQALLEQIHSSRAAYRRMLAQYDQQDEPQGSAAYGNDTRLQHRRVAGMPAAFPRSRSLRWVVDHPLAAAAAVAALVALAAVAPKGVRSGVSAVQQRLRREPQPAQTGHWRQAPVVREVVVQKPSTAGAALAGMMGLATMLLRDPQRMQMAVRTATNAWRWMQSRRQGANSAAARARHLDWNRPAPGA